MQKNNIIKKITIEIGDVEVSVTPEDAKKLHSALGELLGENKPIQISPVIIEKHITPYRPYWQWNTDKVWLGDGQPSSGTWTAFDTSTNTATLKVQ